MPNLNNLSSVVVAECYLQNLDISMGFGRARSLISRYFCLREPVNADRSSVSHISRSDENRVEEETRNS